MKRLIVNADDFGMAEPVNLGIIKGHREGIVTSASLLTCGGAAEHAARLAKENPALGVGVHLCLTLERPVLDPSMLPTLAKGERLPANPFHLMRRFALGMVDRGEIEAELRAQVVRALGLGIRPTHIDGHQHIHMMPGIFPIAAKVALEAGITAVRFPAGPWVGRTGFFRAVEKLMLEGLSKSRRGPIEKSGLKKPGYFFGLPETGRLDAESLREIIRMLPEGISEVMCHPGFRDDALAERLNWGYGWETELKAVTDEGVKALLRERHVELINYSQLS